MENRKIQGLANALRILGIPENYSRAFGLMFKHKRQKQKVGGLLTYVYVLDYEDLELIKQAWAQANSPEEKRKGGYIMNRLKRVCKKIAKSKSNVSI